MGTMPPQELLKKWHLEDITVEMVIGHIVQHLIKILATLAAIKITLHQLRADVDYLAAHHGLDLPSKGKKPPN